MTADRLEAMLLWSSLINCSLLAAWFAVFTRHRSWVYGLHMRWFKLSPAAFDAMNYAGAAVYKIGIVLFNLVPLIALWATAP